MDGSLDCSTLDQCDSVTMSEAMAQFTRAYIAILLIFGLFGNTYCVTAFLMPEYRRVPSSLYLSGLALSDIGFLLTLGLMWMRSIGLRLLDMTYVCTACMFVSYFCCFVSSWLVLAVTLERYLLSKGVAYRAIAAGQRPRCGLSCWTGADWENGMGRAPGVNHHRRVRLIFIIIIILGLLINVWVVFAVDSVGYSVNENGTVSDHSTATICDVTQTAADSFYQIFNILDMIFSFTLPFLGVLILNLKIGFRVCKAQDLARQMAVVSDEEQHEMSVGRAKSARPARLLPVDEEHQQSGDDSHYDRSAYVSPHSPITRRRRSTRIGAIEKKVTKLLVTVSITYLALNLPSYVHRAVLTFHSPMWGSMDSGDNERAYKKPVEIVAETLAYLMFYTQFSINFFLYSCHGCMFGFAC